MDGRADVLAQQGLRVWQPRPDAPALIVLIDEYSELVDEAPAAIQHADSIARRGRAVAVTLVAATQRPSQKAMGQGAVRSQMEVWISFRVRERRDVDLILGQGMLKAGWHSHTLNAPGKFLISAPEHDIPRRARAYLLNDSAVQRTAIQHTSRRSPLDQSSAAALETALLERDGNPAGDGESSSPRVPRHPWPRRYTRRRKLPVDDLARCAQRGSHDRPPDAHHRHGSLMGLLPATGTHAVRSCRATEPRTLARPLRYVTIRDRPRPRPRARLHVRAPCLSMDVPMDDHSAYPVRR